MQNEIDVAYDAARQMLQTMLAVSHYQDHRLSMAFPEIDDPAEQWNVNQKMMAEPRQDKRPIPQGLAEYIETLEQQVRSILPAFQPIPENVMRQGYANWGDIELLGMSCRYVKAALYEIGWSLIHWSKQFAVQYCGERAHVINTVEHDNLRDHRDECPFSAAIYQQLYNRIELEHGRLLLIAPETPAAIAGPAAANARNKHAANNDADSIRKRTLKAAKDETLEKFIQADEWVKGWKASKLSVRAYAARRSMDTKIQNFYHRRTGSGYHWTLQSVKAELKRREKQKAAD